MSTNPSRASARSFGAPIVPPSPRSSRPAQPDSRSEHQRPAIHPDRSRDLPTRHLFGLDFVSSASIREVADHLIVRKRNDDWRCVVTPNVDHLVRYEVNPADLDVAKNASVVLPDGMPIVWASRLLGQPLAARLTGADLFTALWDSIVEQNLPVVLVVSSRMVADRLRVDHPHAHCIVPPVLDADDTQAVAALVSEVEVLCADVGAQFLFIGISMEKHHAIARELRRRWEDGCAGKPTVLLLGQSPEFAVGLVRRAPRWMQRSGLEWVWRLSGDPGRLAKRYLVDDVRFLPLLWREGWSGRAPRGDSSSWRVRRRLRKAERELTSR